MASGGPARDEAAFEDLVAAVRSSFAGVAVRLAGIVAEALGHAASIDATLATMLTTAHDESVSMPGRISIGCSAAAGSPMRATTSSPTWRATSAPSSTGCRRPAPIPIATDATSPGSRQLEHEYRRLAARDATGEVRTMLEELRVSTFAQAVGAKGGVSETKVRRALAALT